MLDLKNCIRNFDSPDLKKEWNERFLAKQAYVSLLVAQRLTWDTGEDIEYTEDNDDIEDGDDYEDGE